MRRLLDQETRRSFLPIRPTQLEPRLPVVEPLSRTFRFVMNYLGWHIRFTELISDALQSARRREMCHSNGHHTYARFATMTFCFSPGTSSMNSVTEKCGCQCRCAYASGIHVSP